MEYQLPRLTKLWTHLERQAGGQVKGMGEKQIEVDKRILRTQVISRSGSKPKCHLLFAYWPLTGHLNLLYGKLLFMNLFILWHDSFKNSFRKLVLFPSSFIVLLSLYRLCYLKLMIHNLDVIDR